MKFSFAKLTKVPTHPFESLILRSPVRDISKCPPTPKSSSHPKWVSPVSGIANPNLYGSSYYGGDYSYNDPYSGYRTSSIYSNRNQYYNSYSNMYPTSSYGRNPSLSSGYGGYYQPFPSQTYLQGQGIDLYRNFDDEQCGLGQDFLIQQAPFGCSPSVVRSDLLEEQNVPVFC